MYCPVCGTDYDKAAETCARCGSSLPKAKQKIAPFLVVGVAALGIVVSIVLFVVSTLGKEEEKLVPAATSRVPAVEPGPPPSFKETDESPSNLEDVGEIAVDSGSEQVILTLPAALADHHQTEELTEEDIQDGIISKTKNPDGSFTFVYKKDNYEEQIKRFGEQTAQNLSNLHHNFPSIRKVDFQEDFSMIEVYVDAYAFEVNADSRVTYTAAVLGYTYQVFSGVPTNQTNVAVLVIDFNTSDVLMWEIYP